MIQTAEDEKNDEINELKTTVDALDSEKSNELFIYLAQKHGFEITPQSNIDGQNREEIAVGGVNETSSTGQSFEFPTEPVNDPARLQRHVLVKFKNANPVTYEKRLMSVRTSKDDPAAARSYLQGRYAVASNSYACQSCGEFPQYIEAVQIEKIRNLS